MRVALIGAGSAGRKHFSSWQLTQIPVEVAYLVDQSPTPPPKIKIYGNIQYVTDWRIPIEDPTIDIIDICLPHYLHKEVALEAIEAGKHVLLEKPIALDMKSTKRIVDATKKTSKIVMIAENWLYSPAVSTALKMINDGVIGEPYIVRSIMDFDPGKSNDWYCNQNLSGGGVLFSAGIHIFSVIRRILGEPIKIYALAGLLSDIQKGIEEDVGLLLDFGERRYSICSISRNIKFQNSRFNFIVVGTKGIMEWSFNGSSVILYKNGNKTLKRVKKSKEFNEEIKHFYDCIINRKTPYSSVREEALSFDIAVKAREDLNNRITAMGKID